MRFYAGIHKIRKKFIHISNNTQHIYSRCTVGNKTRKRITNTGVL